MLHYATVEENEKRLYNQIGNSLQIVVLSEKARHETVCIVGFHLLFFNIFIVVQAVICIFPHHLFF